MKFLHNFIAEIFLNRNFSIKSVKMQGFDTPTLPKLKSCKVRTAEKFSNFHTVSSITKILSIKWLAKLIRFLEPLAEDPIHNLFSQK